MEIKNINNFYNKASFCGKNAKIKKADEMLRISQQAFPSVSPTYMKRFYSVFKNGDKNTDAYQKRLRIDRKLTLLRHEALKLSQYSPEQTAANPYLYNLLGVELFKTGNCSEKTNAVLATLTANGYNDIQLTDLTMDVDFIDKKTKKIEAKYQYDIDHTLLTTSMEKEYKPENKRNIVVDAWLNMANSLSEAVAKYKSVFSKEINNNINTAMDLFEEKEIESSGNINWDNYLVRANLKFTPSAHLTNEQIKEIGDYSKRLFPNLAKEN